MRGAKPRREIQVYIEQLKEDVSTALRILESEIEDADGKVTRELFLWRKLKGEPIEEGELEDFEFALNGLARVPELDFNIGYLGRLMNGDMDAIVSNRELTLQVLDTTRRLQRNLRTINDKVRIIQMADEIFIRHRGRGGRTIKALDMTYDVEKLRNSEKFVFAVENAIEALNAIRRNETNCKSALEDFLVCTGGIRMNGLTSLLIVARSTPCVVRIRSLCSRARLMRLLLLNPADSRMRGDPALNAREGSREHSDRC